MPKFHGLFSTLHLMLCCKHEISKLARSWLPLIIPI